MDYMRQLGLFNPTKHGVQTTLIGCGGIGSPTAFFLKQMGLTNLTVIDPDNVEPHNQPNQLFKPGHIGLPKVFCINELIKEFFDTEIKFFVGKAEEYPLEKSGGILISAIDNMESRKYLFEVFKKNPQYLYFLDCRLFKDSIQFFALSNHARYNSIYEKYLFTDSEIPDVGCVERAIIYAGLGASYCIVSEVKNMCVAFAESRQIPYFKYLALNNTDFAPTFSASCLLEGDDNEQ